MLSSLHDVLVHLISSHESTTATRLKLFVSSCLVLFIVISIKTTFCPAQLFFFVQFGGQKKKLFRIVSALASGSLELKRIFGSKFNINALLLCDFFVFIQLTSFRIPTFFWQIYYIGYCGKENFRKSH